MKTKTAAGGSLFDSPPQPARPFEPPIVIPLPELPAPTITLVSTELAPPTYESLTLDDALDELLVVTEFIERTQRKLNAAAEARVKLRAVIHDRMLLIEAREYDGARIACKFEVEATGSVKVRDPAALKAQIAATKKVPAKRLEEAFPVVTPDPVVTADLRKVRKLADFGSDVAALLKSGISEKTKYDVLVTTPKMIDVTPDGVTPDGITPELPV